MAVTPSTMLALGTPAPAFTLPDPEGTPHALTDFAAAQALVVVFACNHCPYVVHVRKGLGALAREYTPKGIAFVAINSNDTDTYPQDAPTKMIGFAKEAGWEFPYLVDETQEVAKAYHAACTPDLYVFDEDRKLVYRGQLDGSRPGSDVQVTGEDLRAALDALLEGRPVSASQTPSTGCNIKWRPGREPDYYG